MSTIFISHSSQDKAAADELRAHLGGWGFADGDLFLDFDVDSGIRSGEEWENKLYLELRRCKALVVLCSQASMSSPWCFAEIAQAKAAGKHIFPIRVADYDEKLPSHKLIDRIQAIDLRTGGTAYDRLLKGLNLAGLDPTDSFNLDPERPPYPGMFAFEEADAAIYFGRDTEIDAVLDRLARMRIRRDAPFAIIHGGSGCGKSSLLRAGVIPRLKKDRERWVVVSPFRPREQPLEELVRALAQAFHDRGKDIDWKEIRDRLTKEENAATAALSDLAKDLTMAAGQPEARVLLVVDQFEEIFDKRAAGEAERLLRLLGNALKQPGCPVLTLVTMRSEFLGLLQNRAELQGVSFEGIPLGPMPREHLLEAITGPARIANIQIDDGLPDRIVQDVETENALPLLAFTLRQLHEACRERSRFTLDAYEALGGVKGAIQKVVEAAGADTSSSPEEERAVRLAFLGHLVTLNDEGQFTRREAIWDDLPKPAYPAFEKLVEGRLLVTSEREKQRTVEVAHEALFRVWPKLASWLESDREFQLWKKRFAGWCRDWIGAEHARGLLLRSRPLRESRERLREAADRFDPEEVRFIRKSVAHRRLMWGGSVVAVAALLAVPAFLLYQAWRETRAQDLANSAIARLETDPADSVRLAAAAVAERPIPDAWDALRRALLASHVRAVLPPPGQTEGKLESVDDASFSPDGRFVITAGTVGNRGAAHIWDISSVPPVSASRQTNDATGSRPPTLVKSLPHDKPVQAVVFSPDGTAVATASGETVHVWDTTNWKQLGAPVTYRGLVTDIAFGCDSELLASVGSDGRLRLVRPRSGDVQELSVGSDGNEPAPLNAVAFSDDCKWMVTAGDDGTARVWEVATRRQIAAFEPQSGKKKLADASFSPDGRHIVTAGWDNNARVWDMSSNGGTPRELLHRAAVHRAVFSPDGTRVATASDDGTGRLLLREGARDEIAVLANLQTRPLYSVAFSPHGQWLLTAGADDSAQLWSAWSAKPVALLRGHTQAIKAVAFSRDGTRIVTASKDGTARVWEAVPDTGEFPPLAHPDEVKSATFHPAGRLVATASSDGVARVWDVGAEEPTAVLKGHGRGPLSAAFSPDGKFLITASEDTTARVWEWDGDRAWSQVGGPLPHPDPVHRGALGVDGKLAVTACADGTARLWRRDEDGTSWRSSRREHPAAIVSIALSPDEEFFVTASVDGKARVWNVNESGPPVELPGEKPLYGAAFSPDGTLVVTAGEDTQARIWKWKEDPPKLVREIPHKSAVLSAAFSPGPDGRFVITATLPERADDDDGSVCAGKLDHACQPVRGTARIWQARTGKPVAQLPDRNGPLYDAQFSPNGKLLVVAGGDQRALMYRWERFAPEKDLLREAEARLVR